MAGPNCPKRLRGQVRHSRLRFCAPRLPSICTEAQGQRPPRVDGERLLPWRSEGSSNAKTTSRPPALRPVNAGVSLRVRMSERCAVRRLCTWNSRFEGSEIRRPAAHGSFADGLCAKDILYRTVG